MLFFCDCFLNGSDLFPGLIRATCDGPGWTVVPENAADQADAPISPDTNPHPKCICLDITIPADSLEAGENRGCSELYVDNVKMDNNDAPITIPSGNHVVLLCDRHPVMDFSRINAEWKDGDGTVYSWSCSL